MKNNTTVEVSGLTLDDGFVTHSAQVTPALYDVNIDYPGRNPFTPKDGIEFDVECYNTRADTQNVTSTHGTSIVRCMQTCGIRTSGEGDTDCLGVIFDMSMGDGYENCALLNDTGSTYINPPRDVTSVVLTQASMQKTEDTATNGGSGGGSKAWIAGPVIGAILALLLIAGGIFCIGVAVADSTSRKVFKENQARIPRSWKASKGTM